MENPTRKPEKQISTDKNPPTVFAPETSIAQAGWVRVDLVNELEDLQKDLDSYVKGYLVLGAYYKICRKIRAQLKRGKDENRLDDPFYWESMVGSVFEQAGEKFQELPGYIREKYCSLLDALESAQRKGLDAVNEYVEGKRKPDGNSLYREAEDCMDKLEDSIGSFPEKARIETERIVAAIHVVIQRIFGGIELQEAQRLTGTRQRNPADEGGVAYPFPGGTNNT